MPRSPLVVDWSDGERARVTRAIEEGRAVFVRLDCPKIALVPECNRPDWWGFKLRPSHEVVTFSRFSPPMDVATRTSGVWTASRSTGTRPSDDACRRATHYVKAVTVGAYRVARRAPFGSAPTVDDVFRISEHSPAVLADVGSVDACKSTADGRPAPGCSRVVRLSLFPVDMVADGAADETDIATPANAKPKQSANRTDWDQRSWYPQAGIGPALARDAGLIIGLTWVRRSGEVDVVALDRVLLRHEWSVARFPIAWKSRYAHLRLVRDRVLVADDYGDVHVLDVETGARLRVVRFRGRVRAMCAAADGSPRLLVHEDEGGSGVHSLDIDTGAVSSAAAGERCTPTSGMPTPVRRIEPAIAKKVSEPRFAPIGTLADGETRVLVGAIGLHDAFGVGWDPTTNAIGWESRLAAPDDVMRIPEWGMPSFTALSGGRLFYVYASALAKRGYRLVARSARTGAMLYVLDLPSASDNSLTSMTFDGDDVFLAMGTTLVVIDARLGVKRELQYL